MQKAHSLHKFTNPKHFYVSASAQILLDHRTIVNKTQREFSMKRNSVSIAIMTISLLSGGLTFAQGDGQRDEAKLQAGIERLSSR